MGGFLIGRSKNLILWLESKRGPLFGVPFGVKDIFDTVDLPTTCRSEIYGVRKPICDAASVARLRATEAIIMGKIDSTEFTYFNPIKTKNLIDFRRRPGGSSSVSAALVADRRVPFALGSQTAVSIIRLASFCGIIRVKPTWGLIRTARVRTLENSLDMVGILAETVSFVSNMFFMLAIEPKIEEGTENPIISGAWTLLGLPSITVVCGYNKISYHLGSK